MLRIFFIFLIASIILLSSGFSEYIGYPQLDDFFKVLICIFSLVVIYNLLISQPPPAELDPFKLPDFN